jgi:protein SCO1/2
MMHESGGSIRTRPTYGGVIGVALGLLVSGCAGQVEPPADTNGRYEISGTVLGVKAPATITLGHDAIRGFMPAMVMDFAVDSPPALRVGDRVRATLVVTADASRLTDLVVVRSGAVPATGARMGQLPSDGDVVPDVRLTNQFDKPIRLGDFRGRVVVVTFIYTRCPLPDFCPRLMRNFRELRSAIAARPDLAGRVHLLSVTIDPIFDSPVVLKRYGEATMGPGGFDGWDLSTGHPAEVAKLAGFFGLAYEPAAGQINHTMVSAIVSADGRLIQRYPELTWDLDAALGIITREAIQQGETHD